MIQSIKKLGNKIVIIKDNKVYSFENTVKNSKISKLLKTL
jgi:hypothetical protein